MRKYQLRIGTGFGGNGVATKTMQSNDLDGNRKIIPCNEKFKDISAILPLPCNGLHW
jgi:hypothetical protein